MPRHLTTTAGAFVYRMEIRTGRRAPQPLSCCWNGGGVGEARRAEGLRARSRRGSRSLAGISVWVSFRDSVLGCGDPDASGRVTSLARAWHLPSKGLPNGNRRYGPEPQRRSQGARRSRCFPVRIPPVLRSGSTSFTLMSRSGVNAALQQVINRFDGRRRATASPRAWSQAGEAPRRLRP